MNSTKLLLLIAIITSLVSCGGNDDKRLEEVSGIQGQKAAEKQIEEENRNLAAKAEVRENDLRLRTDFYKAFVGTYIGEIKVLGIKSIIELKVQQSYIPSQVTYVRSLDQIESDISKVSLNFLFKHYAPNSDRSTPCQILDARPDTKTGAIALSSGECRNFYQLYLAQDLTSPDDIKVASRVYAQEIYETESDDKAVSFIKGIINLGSTPGEFEIILKRVEEN